jgi:hypothetical protein
MGMSKGRILNLADALMAMANLAMIFDVQLSAEEDCIYATLPEDANIAESDRELLEERGWSEDVPSCFSYLI